MSHRKSRRRDASSLCGEMHADDGVDPREAFSRRMKSEARESDRKSRQLRKQVQRALSVALAGEVGDPALRALEVLRVEPAPDDARLRVTLAQSGDEICDERRIRDSLSRASGFLRACVAGWITRKRTPELVYLLEPRGRCEPPHTREGA